MFTIYWSYLLLVIYDVIFQQMLYMNSNFMILIKRNIPPTSPYFIYFYACQYHILNVPIINIVLVRYELDRRRRKIKVFGKTNGLKSNIIREEIKKEMCELIRNIMITILPSHSFIHNFKILLYTTFVSLWKSNLISNLKIILLCWIFSY